MERVSVLACCHSGQHITVLKHAAAQDWRDTRFSYHAGSSWAVQHAHCAQARLSPKRKHRRPSGHGAERRAQHHPPQQRRAQRRGMLWPMRQRQLCVPARHETRSPRSSLRRSTHAGLINPEACTKPRHAVASETETLVRASAAQNTLSSQLTVKEHSRRAIKP